MAPEAPSGARGLFPARNHLSRSHAMEFTALQILHPKDWSQFEELCRCLFAAIWGDPYTQKNGRAGQPQHGVDVWGQASGRYAGTHCVQCKGKDATYEGKVTRIAEFDAELAKARHSQPEPAYWILATTAPNDGTLQEHARVCSVEREARGAFPVNVLGWETLVALMGEHPNVIEQFYPEHGGHMQELLATVRALPRREELLAMPANIRCVQRRFGGRKRHLATGPLRPCSWFGSGAAWSSARRG